jgi:hypothetical protein
MSSKDCLKTHREKKCVKALKNINDIEDKINVELEKAILLLSLLNCENLDNIKKPLTKIFKKIQSLEREVTISIDTDGDGRIDKFNVVV